MRGWVGEGGILYKWKLVKIVPELYEIDHLSHPLYFGIKNASIAISKRPQISSRFNTPYGHIKPLQAVVDIGGKFIL